MYTSAILHSPKLAQMMLTPILLKAFCPGLGIKISDASTRPSVVVEKLEIGGHNKQKYFVQSLLIARFKKKKMKLSWHGNCVLFGTLVAASSSVLYTFCMKTLLRRCPWNVGHLSTGCKCTITTTSTLSHKLWLCVNISVFDHAFAATVLSFHKLAEVLCVYVCLSVCIWMAIKTITPLRALLGRLTETLMTSDWINRAYRRHTLVHTQCHSLFFLFFCVVYLF